jgi:hypothetical protein
LTTALHPHLYRTCAPALHPHTHLCVVCVDARTAAQQLALRLQVLNATLDLVKNLRM